MSLSLQDLTSSFLIVDASGLIYRSFFAVRGLTSPSGEPTGALYGFIRSLTKAINDIQPQAITIVFDGPNNKASRLKLYPEYKAHRKETPPELIRQIEDAKYFCKLSQLSYLDIPQVEADDTIATLAKQSRNSLTQEKKPPYTVILSADKDLLQLVEKEIVVVNPMKEYAVYEESSVRDEWGLDPKQIRDYLAIVGDSSDNVPGVDGIGPKKALELISSWNTLEKIYENIDQITGKTSEKLLLNRENAFLSQKLVTLQEDVKIPLDSAIHDRDDLLNEESTPEPLQEFYLSKGFKTLIKNGSSSSEKRCLLPTTTIEIVDSEEKLTLFYSWLKTAKNAVILDTETTSLDEYSADIVGLGIASGPEVAFYIDFSHSTLSPQAVVSNINRIIKENNLTIIGHNCKFDLHILKRYGITFPITTSDTLILSWILHPEERTHNLDALSLRLFHKTKIPIEALIGKGGKNQPQQSMKDVAQDVIAQYCSEDVEYTSRIHTHFTKELSSFPQLQKLYETVEMPLLPILCSMEENGIYLNTIKLQEVEKTVSKLIEKSSQSIYEMAGATLNLNSPKQLGELLYTKLQIPPIKKGKTAFSTDAEVLEELSFSWPIAKAILEYRQLEKLRSTYIEKLPTYLRKDTGRIHCSFIQSGTATGRLSCQDPNLQNIPIRSDLGRDIRACFEPQKEGWSFLSCDYSQIELRILAHISEDPTLIQAFQDDLDIHTITAHKIFHVEEHNVTHEMRQRAKAVNFGILYGQKAFGLSKELHIPMKEASSFISAYFERYQRVEEALETLKQKARDKGYTETITGRIRRLPEILSQNQMIRAAQERLSVNSVFQGTAADIIKMAMIRIDNELTKNNFKTKMILQIHDELLFEVPDEEIESVSPIIRQNMEQVLLLKVPLKVDLSIGKNWKEC